MKLVSMYLRGANLVLLSFCIIASTSLHAQARPRPAPPSIEELKAAAIAETEAGQNEAAIRDNQRVLAQDPEWKEGWWNLATVQYAANHFADAEPNLRKVVAFAPKMAAAWALLGLCEFETRDFLLARQHLVQALALGIDDPETSRVSAYHLVLLLLQAGVFDEALALLRQAFPGDPASPQVRFAYGLAMLRVGGLLPEEVDPSKEALIQAAGSLANASPERFLPLLAANPQNPDLHHAYAIALLRSGDKQQALLQFREETRLSPADPASWVEIGSIERQLGHDARSRTALQRARSLRASTPGTNTGERNPYALAKTSSADDPALWQTAMQAYAEGRYQEAADDLKPLLQQHPENGTGWAVLGLSEFARHDLSSALIHLDRGHTLGLNGSAAYLRIATYTLSILLIQSGDFDRASALLAPASRVTPPDLQVRFALGLCLLRRPLLPDQVTPSDMNLVTQAGEIAALLEDSRYDQAFVLFQQLIAHHPSAPGLHYAYGTALIALSRFDEAAAAMHEEIRLAPGSELPYIRLASIEERLHQPASAIPYAKQALALAPQSAEAHYLLGRASLESGDDATALRELQAAARLSPNSPEVHFNLARAYARLRRPEDATRERETFARLNDLAAAEKHRPADQSYTGPRQTGLTTTSDNP